jgi:hypothetical protein
LGGEGYHKEYIKIVTGMVGELENYISLKKDLTTGGVFIKSGVSLFLFRFFFNSERLVVGPYAYIPIDQTGMAIFATLFIYFKYQLQIMWSVKTKNMYRKHSVSQS